MQTSMLPSVCVFVTLPRNSFTIGFPAACLSSIILSPPNGYVKMSPYETGDICIEPERITTSGGDLILREGGPGVCQSRLAARSNASACPTTQIQVTARGGGGARPQP